MSEKPILFSGPMVRAILDGEKTQTRRLAPDFAQAPVEYGNGEWLEVVHPPGHGGDWTRPFKPQPHAVGDTLWVKETWGLRAHHDETDWLRTSVRGMSGEELRATCRVEYAADWLSTEHTYWRPSIFMPRWASRLSLRVTSVRVERLGDISDADARAEGSVHWWRTVDGNPDLSPRHVWEHLWEHVHGDGAWEHDHARWVWVYTFEVAR